MKRFFAAARVDETENGYGVSLDERPLRTPARHPLLVPSRGLAEAIVQEWDAQSEKIDPRSMPLTGLANAAIDRVAPDPERFAAGLAVYGESDLVCYRAEAPARLVERQQQNWDPVIAWARRRYDIDVEILCGIIHQPQPAATLERLRQAVRGRSAFELAGLSPLVTISGSLLLALALAEGEIDLDTAWAAAVLDDLWQAEQWGEDPEAAAALAGRRRDFEAAARFLALLSG